MRFFINTCLLISCVLLVISCADENTDADTSAIKDVEVEAAVNQVEKKAAKVMTEKKAVSHNISAHNYHIKNVPDSMTVPEKKERFKALLVPSVIKVHNELMQRFEEVSIWLEKGEQQEAIAKLKVEYRAETDEELLAALKPHPPSIVIAQAAMESAWATSRFTLEAINIFGVWSFDKNEPRIAAGEQRGEKTIWLKKYTSVEDAVRDNYRVLGRSAAFKGFRQLRMTSTNPYELVKKLDRYSEKGAEYGRELSSMISFNKFAEYDPVFHAKP